VSATLRDKSTLSAGACSTILRALETRQIPIHRLDKTDGVTDPQHEDVLRGIDEVNLLEGLNNGAFFAWELSSKTLNISRVL
jgi:hypothetical protein